MDELGADSFCERCGTRYTFTPTAPQTTMDKARFFARGFKHFVMNDGSSIDEAVQAARIEGGETVKAAEQFQKTFNFCMICRQYACEKCWNENQNACLSCAPLWDTPAGTPDERIVERSKPHSGRGRASKAKSPTNVEWPAEDVEVARAGAAGQPIAALPTLEELIPPPVRPAAAELIPPASRPASELIPPAAPPTLDELIPPRTRPAAPKHRQAAQKVDEPPPFPFDDGPLGQVQGDGNAASTQGLIGGEPARKGAEQRTPSWVTQQEQSVVDEMREKSQEWMARDDDWSLWTTDEAPSRPPKPAAEMAAPPAPPTGPARPARTARIERQPTPEPAPEQVPYEAPGLDQVAARTPAPDDRIGRRSRQTQQPPAFETTPEQLIPPPAPGRGRGHSRAAAPASAPEPESGANVGFDLIGSLRQPATPAPEPAPAPAKPRRSSDAGERRGQVVGRILGGHRPALEDTGAAQPKPLQPRPAAPRKRSKDARPADATPWPTPTRWEDRPIAAEASMTAEIGSEWPEADLVPPPLPPRPAEPDRSVLIPPAPPQPATEDRWAAARQPEVQTNFRPANREWPAVETPAPDPWAAMPRSPLPPAGSSRAPLPAADRQWPPVTEFWPPLPDRDPSPSISPATRLPLEEGESPLVAELWAESAQHVIDLGDARVCQGCGLPLSTHARFCRRCGTAQD